jgi:hypothetical protein
MALHPTHQRGANVEADVGEVIHDINHLALLIQNAGVGIGAIALMVNALIPVVKGRRTGLMFDRPKVRIFARRLIKMSVNTHAHPQRRLGIRHSLKGRGHGE